MGIDYQAVLRKIHELAPQMAARESELTVARELLNNQLENLSFERDQLTEKIEKVKANEKNLRCAQLAFEPIDFHIPPPFNTWNGSIITADGSQIIPDKHQPELFGLINIGSVVLRKNSGLPPELKSFTELLIEGDLLKPEGYMITEPSIELMRDLRERAALLECSKSELKEGRQIIALLDGPIELWGRRDGEEQSGFKTLLSKYQGILSEMAESGIIFAGYVDKPSASPVIRMIEIAQANEEGLEKTNIKPSLNGITDRWLFSASRKLGLPSGYRSAVFGLRSRSDDDYTGQLGLYFFYLNVGLDAAHPQIVRVEIPRWVVDNEQYLTIIHGELLDQCQVMGVKPYPYLLHRAHETANVTAEDKAQVTILIQQAIGMSGIKVGETSNKQSAKDLQGRIRYGFK